MVVRARSSLPTQEQVYISMDKILTPGQDVDTWYGTEWAGVNPGNRSSVVVYNK